MICEGCAEEGTFHAREFEKKKFNKRRKSIHTHFVERSPYCALIGTNWSLIGKLISLIGSLTAFVSQMYCETFGHGKFALKAPSQLFNPGGGQQKSENRYKLAVIFCCLSVHSEVTR